MATFGYQVDFILEKHNEELELQMPFKIRVIGKCFRWSTLQSLWVYSRIMWHTLRNIRSSCIYIVEDMCLVPVFKLLGNKVAYYKKDVNYNSTIDEIIGNVCLSRANLVLIPTQSKRLRFERIAIVDPSNASSGAEAITSLLHETLPKRVCIEWMEKEAEKLQSQKRVPGKFRKLDIIKEEIEQEEQDRGPSRTESEIEEDEDVDGESEAAGTENDAACGIAATLDIPPGETGKATSAAGAKNQENEKVSETDTPTSEEPAEPAASNSQERKSSNVMYFNQFEDIFKDVDDVAVKYADVEEMYVEQDQFDNIAQYFVPIESDTSFSKAGEFLERERGLQDEDQNSGDSEVSIVLN